MPPLEVAHSSCLNFAYNMYGYHSGYLRAYIKIQNANSTVLWEQYGDHGQSWFFSNVTVPPLTLSDEVYIIYSLVMKRFSVLAVVYMSEKINTVAVAIIT